MQSPPPKPRRYLTVGHGVQIFIGEDGTPRSNKSLDDAERAVAAWLRDKSAGADYALAQRWIDALEQHWLVERSAISKQAAVKAAMDRFERETKKAFLIFHVQRGIPKGKAKEQAAREAAEVVRHAWLKLLEKSSPPGE